MPATTPSDEIAPKDRRAARLAAHLAEGVRDGKVDTADALRVLRHELRRRNTNNKMRITRRSKGAQAVIDKYAAQGELPPKNDSREALHADHVYQINDDTLRRTYTEDAWIDELRRLRTVVCVTADENYRLMASEKLGHWGEEKYAHAGVEFIEEIT